MYKRLFAILISVTCFMFVYAQEPMDIKRAQRAAYDWLHNYNIVKPFDSRKAKQKYLKLFSSDETMVFHDYLPAANYPFVNPSVSAIDYAAIRENAARRYNMISKIDSCQIKNIKSNGSLIEMTLAWTEHVSYIPIDLSSRYTYPDFSFRLRSDLKYDPSNDEISAGEIELEDAPMEPFVMLHGPAGNEMTTKDALMGLSLSYQSALQKVKITQCAFDEKYFDYECDTVQNFFGLSFGISRGTPDIEFLHGNDIVLNSASYSGINMGFEYYRQLFLHHQSRIGGTVGLSFVSGHYKFDLDYHSSYADIDPDAAPYERRVTLESYSEGLAATSIALPLTLRYDYFINPKHWSIYACAGIVPAYVIGNSIAAQADWMRVSGYYEWLYGVEMDYEGIYDFGELHSPEWEGKNSSFDKWTIEGLISVGVSYWCPANNLSAGMSLNFRPQIFQSVTPKDEYKLSSTSIRWTPVTDDVSNLRLHYWNLQVQINYNF